MVKVRGGQEVLDEMERSYLAQIGNLAREIAVRDVTIMQLRERLSEYTQPPTEADNAENLPAIEPSTLFS